MAAITRSVFPTTRCRVALGWRSLNVRIRSGKNVSRYSIAGAKPQCSTGQPTGFAAVGHRLIEQGIDPADVWQQRSAGWRQVDAPSQPLEKMYS